MLFCANHPVFNQKQMGKGCSPQHARVSSPCHCTQIIVNRDLLANNNFQEQNGVQQLASDHGVWGIIFLSVSFHQKLK